MIVWMKIIIIFFWNHFSLIDGTYWKTLSKLKLDVFIKKATDVLMHWLKLSNMALIFFFYCFVFITHWLWWRTYWSLIEQQIFVIDSFLCIFHPKKISAVLIVGSQIKWYQNKTKKHIDTRKNLLAFSSLIMNQIESKYLQCKTKHKPTNNIYTEQYNITSETQRNPDRFRYYYIVTSIHYRSISLCCEDGTSLELNLNILLSTLCFCTKPTYIF